MTRIEIDVSALHGFAERVMNDPDKRREMGLAVMRSVSDYERKIKGYETPPPHITEADYQRLRAWFPSPEEMEGT